MTHFMEQHDRSGKLESIGWALFFIWVGIAWLANFGIGIGLLGVAVITLGMQAFRRVSDLPVEGFWVFVGLGFAVAGFWQWYDIQLPLAPIVFIAIGVALLFWKTWSKPVHRKKE
jgi:hypothetical protein